MNKVKVKRILGKRRFIQEAFFPDESDSEYELKSFNRREAKWANTSKW